MALELKEDEEEDKKEGIDEVEVEVEVVDDGRFDELLVRSVLEQRLMGWMNVDSMSLADRTVDEAKTSMKMMKREALKTKADEEDKRTMMMMEERMEGEMK